MEQIIKFGISNYLQLCVEAGFSQIQSHIKLCTCTIKIYKNCIKHYYGNKLQGYLHTIYLPYSTKIMRGVNFDRL